MHNRLYILLIAIIAVLVVAIVVLLGFLLKTHRKLEDKNEAIISEIRENIALRDELQRRLSQSAALVVLASIIIHI